METTAGIDLASEEHRLVVVDHAGRQLEQRRIKQGELGVQALVPRLRDLQVAQLAIERPNGLVVDRLLEAGISVVPVHPNQLAAVRDRHRSGGGKSEGFDGYMLAELARTDMHRLRAIRPDGDHTRTRLALTRARGLERYPSPDNARSLSDKRLAAFVARHRYSGHRPEELLTRLREPPTGRTGELEHEAPRQIVLGLAAALKPIVEQIKLLSSQIRGALDSHPDGHIFRSLFRDPKSVVTDAALVAEIGDQRDRYDSHDRPEARAGQSPVTIESGKNKVASFRWACNKTLRDAVCVLTDSSRHHNPSAEKIYADAIARGRDHPNAIRILGRAWLRIVWRLWHDRTPYDAQRHGNLSGLLTTQG